MTAPSSQGDATAVPCGPQTFDIAVSGLVLNFVPDVLQALAEFCRVLRTGGVAAAYVWDYAEGMQMLRYFWDAAATLDPGGASLDEGERFPLCRPDTLAETFRSAGLDEVTVRPLVVATEFRDFHDFWDPFLGGQGAAPVYLKGLSEAQQSALKDRLSAALPGPWTRHPLTARARLRGASLGKGEQKCR
jgi:SAM-dependent methyltransferase